MAKAKDVVAKAKRQAGMDAAEAEAAEVIETVEGMDAPWVPDGPTLSYCAGLLRARAVMARGQTGALAPANVLEAMADRFQEIAEAQ